MSCHRYHGAGYLCSAHRLSQLPPDNGKEIAFVGRSNAGKSSVINALTRQKGLARTSRQPGRTRQINFFTLGADTRLADLPGYGYARVPGALKQHWVELINAYLERRRALVGLILIVDIRRALTERDSQMLRWCEAKSLPAHVLLNKADKLSRGAAGQAFLAVEKSMAKGNTVQLFSATKKRGIDELTQVMDAWIDA